MICRGCNSLNLTAKYQPLHSQVKVCICENCHLIQSHGRVKIDNEPKPSCYADYGNLRIGKLGRAHKAVSILSQEIKVMPPVNVLDIGSSRGEFLQLFEYHTPNCNLVGIEPDKRLDKPTWFNGRWLQDRIEDVNHLPYRYYDAIVMLHTLEHLYDPFEILQKVNQWLSNSGVLYIEVPNTRYSISYLNDVVEEYFIDKHTVHFTPTSLMKLLNKAGLQVTKLFIDKEHISIVCRKNGHASYISPQVFDIQRLSNFDEKKWFDGVIEEYTDRLYQNHNILDENLCNDYDFKNTVAWGAGRILDALCENGLGLNQFIALVDNHYPLDKFRGVTVERPSILSILQPDKVLVCSRSSFDEITREVKLLSPDSEVINWQNFLK